MVVLLCVRSADEDRPILMVNLILYSLAGEFFLNGEVQAKIKT